MRNKPISSKGNLVEQTRLHIKEKPYQFVVCKKQFTPKGYLIGNKKKSTIKRNHTIVIFKANYTKGESYSALENPQ